MKKWLIAEAVVLTFLPTVLLLYQLSSLLSNLRISVFFMAGDPPAWYELLFYSLPSLGGLLGLLAIWRYALALSRNRSFSLDWWFIAAAIGGGLASWQLVWQMYMLSSENIFPSAYRWLGILICVPTWLLVGHLLYLRGTIDGMSTNACHENEGAKLKKWLIVETIVLTILPTVLLLEILPILPSGIWAIVFPMDRDYSEWYERLFALLPILGGIFGLLTVWRYSLALSRNRSFPLDWWFVAAATGGVLASWMLIDMPSMGSSADMFFGIHMSSNALIFVPPWLLVGHQLYLRGVLRRHADQIDR